ncbi:MAG: type II toxin-antitoxin system prevent-host-death family antitoxin [Calothrix sp. FI2-JRJ7]|jgi:prevent-host-death family protein|nr:type II toxin-antitoxin system prevent-host-death family antitoxin [Calothrix sp. FI2-JRJ7]
MLHITIDEIQNNLLQYLLQVEEGESFVIMQGDKPIAKLTPVSSVKQLRPFGLCVGEFTVPDDFDASLPDDIISGFEGR